MKFQKLTIKNIASIEDAVIDFENGPLGEDSIFLICGETGAGKSTILDAICLALYNETPRMKQAACETYRDTTKSFSGKQEEIRIDDARQLMRRNTIEAFAELDFIGNNDIPYTARWYVKRAYRKMDGTVQKAEWSLYNHRTGTELRKDKEIQNEILLCIGLNFDQFCRTTMLAQGEFTRFLQSRESEKSDILEKLTGTEIYSRIGSEIFNVRKEKEQEYDRQNILFKDITLLGEEEIDALNKQIDSLEKECTAKTAVQKSVADKLKWMEDREKLKKEIVEKAALLEQAKAELLSDESKDKELLIRQWNMTADIRHSVSDRKKLIEAQTEIEKRKHLMYEFFAKIYEGEKWLIESTEAKEKKLKETIGFLDGEKPNAEMYANSQMLTTNLRRIADSYAAKRKYTQEKSILEGKLPTLGNNMNEAEKRYRTLTAEKEKWQSDISNLNTRLESMNLKSLQERNGQLNQSVNSITEAISALEITANIKTVLDTNIAETNRLSQAITEYLKRKESQTEACRMAEKAFSEAETLYEKQKEATEDYAREARARLVPGDLCPVCGQEITTLPDDEHFQSLLAPVRENMENRKKALDESRNALNGIMADIRSSEESLNSLKAKTSQLSARYNDALTQAAAKCRDAGIEKIDENAVRLLAEMKEGCNRELDSVRNNLTEANSLASRISAANKTLENKQKEENAALDSLNTAKDSLENVNRRIGILSSLIQSETENAANTLAAISGKISWKDWNEEWESSPEGFIRRIEDASALYTAKENERTSLENELKQNRDTLTKISTVKEETAILFPALREIHAGQAVNMPDLAKKWDDAGRAAILLNKDISDNSNALSNYNDIISSFLSDHPDISEERLAMLADTTSEHIAAEMDILQKKKDNVIAQNTKCETAVNALNEHDKHRPELTEDENAESLARKEEELKQETYSLNQQIGQIKARIEENDRQKTRLAKEKEKLDALYAEFIKWDRISKFFGDATGKKFRNIAQSFVLKELLHGANTYLSRLTNRYRLECQPGSLTILLRDDYQGGAARPASTLSGGESFLVSLSLALGLSSISMNSMSVNTLFIDEGFGTLSETYLNVVMDTLEKLHQMGGKKVGIISHVEGLRERIRTQIQVKRIDSSRSEIKIVTLD